VGGASKATMVNVETPMSVKPEESHVKLCSQHLQLLGKYLADAREHSLS
jgi:hypothetical protein